MKCNGHKMLLKAQYNNIQILSVEWMQRDMLRFVQLQAVPYTIKTHF